MTDKNKQQYIDIMAQICPDSIRASIDMLRLYATEGATTDINARIDELEQRYFYMLRFIAGGNVVPGAKAELKGMADTARDIAGAIYLRRLTANAVSRYGAQLRFEALRPEENLQSLVSDYLAELQRLRTDSASLTDSRRAATLERLAADIFMHLWVESPITAEIADLVVDVCSDDDIPLYDRQLWLGAIGLGLFTLADTRHVALLLTLVRCKSDDISAIAALWLVMANGFLSHAGLPMAPVLKNIAAAHTGDISDAYLEFYRACGARAIADSFERDIMPRMMDIGRKMTASLTEDPDQLQEKLANGEWTPDLGADQYENIKSFLDAQNSGDDIYMSSLGKMRHFPFFNSLHTWFLPFYASNSAIADITEGEGVAFADTVDRMPYLCDSDKYALMLSMAMTPAAMRDNMLRNIAEQQANIDQEAIDEALGASAKKSRRDIMSRYVKNLYRFFNLFPNRTDIHSPFDPEEIFDTMPLQLLTSDELGAVAALLMRLRYYSHAANLYGRLAAEKPDSLEMVQKYGFALELAGDADAAVHAYTEALALRSDDRWTLRRLAATLTALGRYAEVVSLLASFQEGMSDDLELLALYAEAARNTGDIARALELYYNIEYLEQNGRYNPEIAWLQLLNGDTDSAVESFASFIDTPDATPLDVVHYGHLLWSIDHIDDAIEQYVRAAAAIPPGRSSFLELFEQSLAEGLSQILSSDSEATLRTIPDIISFKTYGSRLGKI